MNLSVLWLLAFPISNNDLKTVQNILSLCHLIQLKPFVLYFCLSRMTAFVHCLTTGPVQDAAAVHSSCRSGFLPLHFPVERKQPAGHTQVSRQTINDCGTRSRHTFTLGKWHTTAFEVLGECRDRGASSGQMWYWSETPGPHVSVWTITVAFRVLTLWFDYGHWPEVNEALVEGIKTIQIDTWLQVTHTTHNILPPAVRPDGKLSQIN